MSNTSTDRHFSSYLGALAAFVGLLLVTMLLLSISAWLQGFGLSVLRDPLGWLSGLDQDAAASSLSDAAQLVANVVAIAITVVAIVVELSANRYSHQITRIFVTEPINIVVMSLFIVTTVQCVWIAATLGSDPVNPVIPNAGYGISMLLVSIALLILLPYFAFVFSFLSPKNIIRKIRVAGARSIHASRRNPGEAAQRGALTAIDELQDIARRATELNDRAVAMASLNALADLLLDYQSFKAELPAAWFKNSPTITQDPDFVSLAPTPLEDIERYRTWVEVKILRQYISMVTQGGFSSRDIINLIAINTRRIGVLASSDRDALLDLCVRCFNSYLRATINSGDQRSSYYVMNQYRQLAESILSKNNSERIGQIAKYLQFYALLAYKYGQPFLLEVAAYDIVRLIEQSIQREPKVVDDLLDLLLDLDQEVKDEQLEHGNLGVRRAQIQLATLFMQLGDEARAEVICRDLKTEEYARLEGIAHRLMDEERPQFWEVTDRGVNFSYLSPDRRRYVPILLDRLTGAD